MALPLPFPRTAGPDDERRARLRLARLLPWANAADPPGSDVTGRHPPPDPEGATPARVAIDARAVTLLAVLAVLGALLGGWLLWRARPVTAEIAAVVPPASAAPAVVVPTAAAPSGPDVVVDVQGEVRRPGVVRLPPGSRVLDAVAAAGGPRAGASTAGVNLARVLTDGEQIVLLPPGSTPPAVPAPAGPAGAAAGPLDLNAATLADLDMLPGVGPVLAQRILDWRAEHGRFSAVDELQEVPGIGPAKYEQLRARVRV